MRRRCGGTESGLDEAELVGTWRWGVMRWEGLALGI